MHAYVLMSNHYDLLLETPEANLVAGMKWFQGTYTQRFNAMFKKRGHLFQGRYKAIPIQTDSRLGGLEYFRMVSTYIHLNPFRAGLAGVGCSNPLLESYLWSSYPAYCGQTKKCPDWLVREKVLKTWDVTEAAEEVGRDYQKKMERFMRFELDPDAGRRGDFEKQIKRGWMIGSEAFGEKLLKALPRRKNQPDTLRGEVRRAHGESEANRLIDLCCQQFDYQLEQLQERKNTHLEKQALAWLLKLHTTVTGVWIAERLKMGHRTNASRAIKVIESSEDQEILKIKELLLQCTA
jgi:hypothetical protein